MGGRRRSSASSARVRSPVPKADEDVAVAPEADAAEEDPTAPGYDEPSLESRM
jgi:hypothetical protein